MNVRKKIIKGLVGLVAALVAYFPLFAQKGWEAGLWLGGSHYFGDLNTSYDLGMPGPSGGILARYNFNNRVCLKFSANAGSVKADDARSENPYEKARNLNFTSSLLDGSAQIEFNFLPFVHGSKQEFFSPYLFGGFSAVYFNPMTEYNGEMMELRPLGTEGQFKGEEYYSISGALLYGFGLKISLNYEWSINIELGGRSLFTDYLDDVSTVYPRKSDLLKQRGEVSVALSDRTLDIPGVDSNLGEFGTQRGNSNTKDQFIMLGVGIVYYFGDLECPAVSRKK